MRPISPKIPEGTGAHELEGHGCCLLTTFRRDGTAVATPVWFTPDGTSILVNSDDPSGKVRRIRNNPRVTVAPCTLRGRPLGSPIDATAEILDGAAEASAAAVMGRSYGVGKRLFYALVHPLVARGKATVYLRITPERG